jgi:hypothetical protein
MAIDFYELRVQGLHQTEYNECVMYFKGDNLTAADYITNAGDLASSFESDMKALWLACLPASYALGRLSAKKASTGGGGTVDRQQTLASSVGTVSGGAASQQLCPVVRLIPPMGVKTAGKIFMPCIAESMINSNVVTAGWLAAITNMMNDLMGGFGPGSITWTLQVFSRVNRSFSDVLAFDTSPIVGFQRRRQRSPL